MASNKIMRFVVSAVVLVALMTLTAFAADITGGFGAIGGVDDTYYAAPATLNAAGTALELGDAIQLTTANNTGLAGLYAVSTDSTFEGDYEIVYVYGDYDVRSALITTDDSTSFLPTKSTNNSFSAGTWTGAGYWGKAYNGGINRYEITAASGGKHFESDFKEFWFYNQTWDEALAEAATLAGEDETALATYKATVDALYSPYFKADAHNEFIDDEKKAAYEAAKKALCDKYLNRTQNTIELKYAYTSGQILPVSEVNSFKIYFRQFTGCVGYAEAFSSKVIAFVYNPTTKKVEQYSADTNAVTMDAEYNQSSKARTVDFANKEAWSSELPQNGYLVGLRILPLSGMNDPTKFTTNLRTKITPANYNSFDSYSRIGLWINTYSIDVPKATKPTGLGIDENGALTGTLTGMTYEYATVSSAAMLNGTALAYTTVDANTALTDAGLYAVRVAGVDGEYTQSDVAFVYKSGEVSEKKAIIERTVWQTSGKKSVDANKVAYDEDNNPIHPTYGNPLKLVGTTYYVVAVDADGDGWDDNFPTSKVGYDSTNEYYYVYNYTELRVAAKNTTDFADGFVTASDISTTFWSGSNRYWSVGVTSGRNISAANLTAFKTAQDKDPYDEEADKAKKAAFDTIINAKSVKNFSYAYAIPAEKVSTIKEMVSYAYRLYFYEDVKYEGLKVKFEAYVMDDNGVVTPYSYIHNAIDATTAASTLTVDFGTATNGEWETEAPTDGYLLGFKIYPFYGFTDYTKFTVTSTSQTNLMFYPLENGATIKTANTTPEISLVDNLDYDNYYYTLFEIDNFVQGATYAYSIDEGKTWTEFTTDTIEIKKANVTPWVKALGDATHFDSEVAVSDTSTSLVILTGTSIVLDGQIGMRFYFDVDTTKITEWTQWNVKLSNKDTGTDLKPIKQYRFAVGKSGDGFATFMEDGRTAYVTLYVPAKDFDNAVVTTSNFLVYEKGVEGRKNLITMVSNAKEYSVAKVISMFEGQVEAGNEECIAAEDLVAALKTYCENADAYFDTEAEALDTVEADAAAIAAITAPQKSGKFTYNGSTILEHYSTSLILEENVVIRHYFKATAVEGQPTFTTETVTATETNGKAVAFDPANYKASTTTDGVCYYYVDITNIDAKNLDTQYELNLTMGDETITVKYSALNYVKQTYNDTTTTELTKLANLVKAIYNYSVEAEAYVK